MDFIGKILYILVYNKRLQGLLIGIFIVGLSWLLVTVHGCNKKATAVISTIDTSFIKIDQKEYQYYETLEAKKDSDIARLKRVNSNLCNQLVKTQQKTNIANKPSISPVVECNSQVDNYSEYANIIANLRQQVADCDTLQQYTDSSKSYLIKENFKLIKELQKATLKENENTSINTQAQAQIKKMKFWNSFWKGTTTAFGVATLILILVK